MIVWSVCTFRLRLVLVWSALKLYIGGFTVFKISYEHVTLSVYNICIHVTIIIFM